jgi:DnaJ-class molecular chaperone
VSAPTLLEVAGDAARVIHATLCGSSCAPVCDDLRSAIVAEEARQAAERGETCPRCQGLWETCAMCGGRSGGTGEAKRAEAKCATCCGTGKVLDTLGGFDVEVLCPTCGGTGERKP